NQAFGYIAIDIFGSALGWITKAPSAGGQERHAISGFELNFRFLIDGRLFAVFSRDDAEIDGALATAMKAPGGRGRAFEIDIGLARLQAAISESKTKASAIAALASGIGAQAVLLDHERIFDLLQFDRRVAHI